MLGREHFLRRPTFGQASAKSTMRDAKSSCPFAQAQRFPVVSQHSSFASVLSLLQFCGPAAIIRAVPKIVVLAINSGFWKRFRPHVGKKVVEADFPSVTKRYTSVSVQVFVFVVRFASSLHLLPRCVFGRIAHASCTCSSASARLCASFAKFSSRYSSCIPTFALAKPARVTAFCFSSKLKNSQLAVNISRLVFNAGRQLDRIIRRHSSTPCKLDCDRAKSSSQQLPWLVLF